MAALESLPVSAGAKRASLDPVTKAALARQRRRKRRLRKLLLTLLVAALGVLFFVPFLWMLSTSLKFDTEVYRIPPTWIPQTVRWANYPEALTYVPFGRYFGNTMFYAAFTVAGTVFSSALVAYSFSRLQWKQRDLVFGLILATMMVPYQVTMIPQYLIFKRLGWLNTYLPMIVPSYFGMPYFIFMMRQFFMTIPMELSDAARIDGCTEFRIFTTIILPLAKPSLAAVGLFRFMDCWNDYMGPLIYLRDTKKYTVALGLQYLRQYGNAASAEQMWPRLMAASTVVTVPIMLLYFFTQRTFVEGIALTGVKG
ncbi:MAG: carbohydrate ABC transporter permease [Anaerolineales bacterium]